MKKQNKEKILKMVKKKHFFDEEQSSNLIKSNDLYSLWFECATSVKWKKINYWEQVSTDIYATIEPDGRAPAIQVREWKAIQSIVKYALEFKNVEINVYQNQRIEVSFEDESFTRYTIYFNL